MLCSASCSSLNRGAAEGLSGTAPVDIGGGAGGGPGNEASGLFFQRRQPRADQEGRGLPGRLAMKRVESFVLDGRRVML